MRGVKGDGVGESFEIRLDRPRRIDEITILTGDQRDHWKYDHRNRPTELELTLGDTTTRHAVDGDYVRPLYLDKLTFTAVDGGTGHHSCLSEVILNTGVGTPTLVDDPKALAAFPAAVEALVDALEGCDAARLRAQLTLPIKAGEHTIDDDSKVTYRTQRAAQGVPRRPGRSSVTRCGSITGRARPDPASIAVRCGRSAVDRQALARRAVLYYPP